MRRRSGGQSCGRRSDPSIQLGPPTGGEGAGKSAVWVDAATRFRLFETPGPDGPTVASHLVDLGAGE